MDVLATITLEVVPFRVYAQFRSSFAIFKCILEAVFCEGVQQVSRFCLDHLSCVKMVACQFYL
jgi:hypothetical protein